MRKNLTTNLKIFKNVWMIKISKSYFIQFPTVRASVAIPSKTVPVPYSTPRAVPHEVKTIDINNTKMTFKEFED